MELKLANTEENNKEEGGLRLSGGLDKSGTDTRPEQTNPWDFDRPEGPVTTRSISSSAIADTSMYKSSAGDVHIVVKIGRIIVYVCMLFMLLSIIWIVTQPKIDIYINMRKFSPLFSLCSICMVVDSILVNALYERKISLIFWVWFLMIFYPMKRDKHVNGEGLWGGLVCVGMLMAYVALIANVMTAFTTYGKAIQNEEETVRTAVAAFMEHPDADGGDDFGSKLKKNFSIQNVDVVTQGNQTILVFQGYGRYGANKDGFIDYGNKTVETQLGFVKDASGDYQLSGAVLGNMQLSEYYLNYYWKNIIQ